jgi:hypothetical protein
MLLVAALPRTALRHLFRAVQEMQFHGHYYRRRPR